MDLRKLEIFVAVGKLNHLRRGRIDIGARISAPSSHSPAIPNSLDLDINLLASEQIRPFWIGPKSSYDSTQQSLTATEPN